MTENNKNNKMDELAEALLKWAKEDDNRSVILIAGDGKDVTRVYHGRRGNLIESLTESVSRDKEMRSVCVGALFVRALLMNKENEANDHDEAETDND